MSVHVSDMTVLRMAQYLCISVTQKAPEDENFRIDAISYRLQSVILRIEKNIHLNPRVFQRVSRKPSIDDPTSLKF